jgi:hypothetical protein
MILILNTGKVSFDGFFTDQLKEMLEAPREIHHTTVIRPSQILECKRWIVGDLLGFSEAEDLPANTHRVLDNGTYVHKRYLQKYIPKMGCAVKIYDVKERRIKPFIEITLQDFDYWLKGSPDALILNKNDGLPYVFELKSMREFLFRSLIAPEPAHVAQLHLYMFLTNVPRGILFYEAKDSQDTKEFLVNKDDSLLVSLLSRIRDIQALVSQYHQVGKLPLCEFPSARKCRCNELSLPKGAL